MRLLLLLCCLSCLTPSVAQADFLIERIAQNEISESQAVAIAQRQIQGKVLGVQRISRGDHVVYRVRILTEDGRVRNVTVDGKTGRVSE